MISQGFEQFSAWGAAMASGPGAASAAAAQGLAPGLFILAAVAMLVVAARRLGRPE